MRYRPVGAAALLQRILLIYGLGGVIVPFIGIKLVDLVVAALGAGLRYDHAQGTLSSLFASPLVTLVLTGLVYPVVTTGLARAALPAPGRGELCHRRDREGRRLGADRPGLHRARLLPAPALRGGQGRAGTPPARAAPTSGPTSKKLRDSAAEALQKLQAENPGRSGPVPVELVTASASGLDPHLSPAGALWQVARVARARQVSEDRVRALVESQLERRDLFVLGEPRVNVLVLNLALDRQFGAPDRGGRSAIRTP